MIGWEQYSTAKVAQGQLRGDFELFPNGILTFAKRITDEYAARTARILSGGFFASIDKK